MIKGLWKNKGNVIKGLWGEKSGGLFLCILIQFKKLKLKTVLKQEEESKEWNSQSSPYIYKIVYEKDSHTNNIVHLKFIYCY